MPTIELTDAQYRETVRLIKDAIDREYCRARNNYMFPDETTEGWEYVALMSGAMAAFSRVQETADAND
jgi:hypothetical protein